MAQTVLNGQGCDEHKMRKQQQLRSCLDNTEELANQYNERKNEKKVIELEVTFDEKTSLDEVTKQFKGMHVVSSDFNQNNFTGRHTGKGTVKLRVDDRQADIINKRLDQTPHITAKKVEESSHNKKLD